ncbi:ABC transporter ATP-binding protein [Neobacillus mesonae]|nr:ABC transporter ATP-binding protein [Neobacillus mesonae]
MYDGYSQDKALDNVRFQVRDGEFVGIMGPSGSGKTTLLNAIATIDPPSSGEIRISGHNAYQMTAEEMALFRRRRLGFVFQDFNLLDSLTVEENILLPLTLDGVPQAEMNTRVDHIISSLGIESIRGRMVHEISGGQKQKTAIGRALIHKPAVVLADEPTGNLDSKSTKDVMNLLQRLHEQEHSTLLMVTHDAYAASYCERVIFIKDGKLYNEIYRGDNRQAFFQKIIDMLALLGGDRP